MENIKITNSNVIVVDLDGTLIQFDSSFEIAKKLAKRNLFLGLKFVWIYLTEGEAKIKHFVADLFDDFEYESNKTLIKFLQKAKAQGRKLVIATGANIKVANKINKDLGNLFEQVVASDENVNCIGVNKLNAIKKIIKDDKFLYIGDYWHDLPIWNEASEIGIVVNENEKTILLELIQDIAYKEKKRLVVFKWEQTEIIDIYKNDEDCLQS